MCEQRPLGVVWPCKRVLISDDTQRVEYDGCVCCDGDGDGDDGGDGDGNVGGVWSNGKARVSVWMGNRME